MDDASSKPVRIEWTGPDGEDWSYEEHLGPLFHVTDARNRASILARGLDWRHMGEHAGIAGHTGSPELPGVFLAQEHDVDWFVGFARRRGIAAVDVWSVDIDGEHLIHDPGGYIYSRDAIPASRVRLARTVDLPGVPSDF